MTGKINSSGSTIRELGRAPSYRVVASSRRLPCRLVPSLSPNTGLIVTLLELPFCSIHAYSLGSGTVFN
ncbi:hypothetical protein WJX74_000454 [Apatococcus lobatus]|uniref:Uncharacterized protein n=1 Tax=Apatococcus lobatus TaxID=904363 RepID=A0AAW1RSZ6_9CHLO